MNKAFFRICFLFTAVATRLLSFLLSYSLYTYVHTYSHKLPAAMECTALSLQFMFVLPVSYSRVSVTVLVVYVCVCVCRRLSEVSLIAGIAVGSGLCTIHSTCTYVPYAISLRIEHFVLCYGTPKLDFATTLLSAAGWLGRAAFFVSVLCAPNWLCEFFLAWCCCVPFRFVSFYFISCRLFHAFVRIL